MVSSDKHGLVTVSSLALYTYLSLNNYQCQIHPSVSTPTVLNLKNDMLKYYGGSKAKTQLWTKRTFLLTARTEDEWNTQANRTELESIDDSLIWIWGSIFEGGIAITLDTSNYPSLVVFYGLCKDNNVEDGYCYYYDQPAIRRWYADSRDADQLRSCYFAEEYNYSLGGVTTEQSYNQVGFSNERGRQFWFHPMQINENASADVNASKQLSVVITPGALIPSYTYDNRTPYEDYSAVMSTATTEYLGVQSDVQFKRGDIPNVTYSGTSSTNSATSFYEYPPVRYSLYKGDVWGNGIIPDQPNTSGGTSGGGGGGGKFDNTTDNDDFTDHSNWTDATDTGFISLYNPTKAELKDLATFLFTGISASAEITLKKLLANPMDYIVSLNMIHFPLSSTIREAVKFGGISTNVIMNKLSKQFIDINGGYYDIDEQFMSFLDYGKYSSIKISIPYCGIYPLPTDALMGGRLSIKYTVDLLTGTLIAELKISRQRSYVSESQTTKVIATYTGNCFLPIPIASTDYRNAVSSLLGITSGLATSVATGNPLPLIGSSANAVVNSKSDVNMGGNMGSNYGYLASNQRAFLILERPYQNLPINYPYYYGYPSNVRFSQLNKVAQNYGNGYIELDQSKYWVGSVTNGFGSITKEESEELEQIVENGIWI